MRRIDPARLIFYATSAVAAVGLIFGLGLHAAAKQTAAYRMVHEAVADLKLVWAERKTVSGLKPVHFLQPARQAGDGVTINAEPEGADELVLLAGFFRDNNGLRLIRRDGTVVARWEPSFEEIFGDAQHLRHPPQSDWNVEPHGSIALPDGSVVFNFEGVGAAKLDRCGALVWRTDRVTHHSIERAAGGGFWVSGRRFHLDDSDPRYPPFKPPYREDTVLKLADDGRVVAEYSIIEILRENGLEALVGLTGQPRAGSSSASPGQWPEDPELFHMNDVEELGADLAGDFPMFAAGDLMVSLRNRSLVLVFDPDTRKVKWWHIGPWIRQHDPDFRPGGTITVFSNNPDWTDRGTVYGGSTIIEIDPATNRSEVIYGRRPGQKMFTSIRGKLQNEPDGHLLITEAMAGRALEVNGQGKIIWQYINRYDAEEVAMLTEARAYPAGYFTVKDWSCGRPQS